MKNLKEQSSTTKFLLFLIIFAFLAILIATILSFTENEIDPQTEPVKVFSSPDLVIETSGSAVSTDYSNEITDLNISGTNDHERLLKLESDVEEFLNTYTKITDGTYKQEKAKYDVLKNLYSDKGSKENLMELGDKSTYKAHENLVSIKNKNVTVYVKADESKEDSVTVVLLATQVIKRLGKELNSYPYQLIGTFVYDSTRLKWLCDEIETACSYRTNLQDEREEGGE